MAKKLVIPAKAGAGSAAHATKTIAIPGFRRPKFRVGGTGVGSLPTPVVGQIWPRRN